MNLETESKTDPSEQVRSGIGRMQRKWEKYFKDKGFSVVKVNSRSGAGVKSINGVIQEACREKIERDRRRGILNRPVRAMVVEFRM